MPHRILLTGASGYLGGTLLAQWTRANLPPDTYDRLYVLVRTDAQADAIVQGYHNADVDIEPIRFDVRDEKATRDAIVGNKITIVLFLIDAFESIAQVNLIRALAEVKKEEKEMDVHFIHTSGAKIFSSHAGATTDRPLLDTEDDLYEIQKAQKPPIPPMQIAIDTNNTVIEQTTALGVHGYIFVPCIVYGKGEGFGNPISIQTAAIVRAARALRRVYAVDADRPVWPVCHVLDNTSLYLAIVRAILAGENPASGQHGYYLASSGGVAWEDLYGAIASSLAARKVVDDATVDQASEQVLSQMAPVLGCQPEMVALQLGGRCTFTARRGEQIGWRPRYAPEHILEAADEEVELILANLNE